MRRRNPNTSCRYLVAIFLFWLVWPAYSQAEQADPAGDIALIEQVFDATEVDLDTAAELITRSAGHAQIDLAPIGKTGNEPVTLADVAYLIVEAYDMPAGLMYALAPGPRYAYRELRFRRLIFGDAYEYSMVDGRTLLDLLSRIGRLEGTDALGGRS